MRRRRRQKPGGRTASGFKTLDDRAQASRPLRMSRAGAVTRVLGIEDDFKNVRPRLLRRQRRVRCQPPSCLMYVFAFGMAEVPFGANFRNCW